MKHTARYLDSGFYVISDKAAGHLVRSLGQKLPKHGWEKFVMLTADGLASMDSLRFNAWLQRTDVRHSMRPGAPKRGWVWALYGLRPDGVGSPVTLGKSFRFVSISTLNAKAA